MRSFIAALHSSLPAAAAVLLLVVMIATGGRPAREQFVAYEAAGVMAAPPAAVRGVVLRAADRQWTLARTAERWRVDGVALTAELESHLLTALQYLHVVRPIRRLDTGEAGELAEYGLAAPRLVVRVLVDDGRTFEFAFGASTPAGAQQYVAVAGSAGIHLLSEFIGAEWQAVVQSLP